MLSERDNIPQKSHHWCPLIKQVWCNNFSSPEILLWSLRWTSPQITQPTSFRCTPVLVLLKKKKWPNWTFIWPATQMFASNYISIAMQIHTLKFNSFSSANTDTHSRWAGVMHIYLWTLAISWSFATLFWFLDSGSSSGFREVSNYWQMGREYQFPLFFQRRGLGKDERWTD